MKIKNSSLPRNRSIEMMSTTISTNLNCNMACKHCYIQPELLRRKEYIDEKTYRRCVEVLIEAFHLDDSVSYLHLDVLGGEATLMPYEFWESNLPWTLDKVNELNAAGIQTEFTFCTNLMWKDDRYLELLREHRHNPAMDIAISFEGPESGRFGRNMAIFPKFLKRIEALGDCNMLNLVLIMGQGVIDLGPQYVIDTFVKRGITDVTCDMVFPWGSGKAYFEAYQPQYAAVARYISELSQLGKPFGLTVDHLDDMRKSLATLSRSQNTLNDAYEYHWDHRGNISLNPNQTGSEAVLPYINLNVWEENAALKVIWGNCSELDNKLSFEHEFCKDCKFLQACNGGWYPHKDISPEKIATYMQPAPGADQPCPGFYELWEQQSTACLDEVGVTRYGDQRRIRKATRLKNASQMPSLNLCEQELSTDYEGFFRSVAESTYVSVTNADLFGLSPRQRLWFYDRLGKQVEFDGGILSFNEAPSIIAHAVAGNYHTIEIPASAIAGFLELQPNHSLTLHIQDAISLALNWEEHDITIAPGFTRLSGSGLEVSYKFEDLLLWAMTHKNELTTNSVNVASCKTSLTPSSSDYMNRLSKSAYRITRLLAGTKK